MKLAEALVLRKSLAAKVAQLTPIKHMGDSGVLEIKHERMKVDTGIDAVKFQIPKITMGEITKEYDFYAGELRKVDVAIQKANWQFDVDFVEGVKPVAS